MDFDRIVIPNKKEYKSKRGSDAFDNSSRMTPAKPHNAETVQLFL